MAKNRKTKKRNTINKLPMVDVLNVHLILLYRDRDVTKNYRKASKLDISIFPPGVSVVPSQSHLFRELFTNKLSLITHTSTLFNN